MFCFSILRCHFFSSRFPLQTKTSGILSLRHTQTIFSAKYTGKLSLDLIDSNASITRLMRNGLFETARQVFDEMPQRNVVSWNAMIRGSFQNGRPDQALQLFDEMPERDLFSWNTMITGLTGNGDTDRAKWFFDQMPVRDIVSWNSMIAGYVRQSMLDVAFELFERMPVRDTISWNTIMAGFANWGYVDLAEEFFNKMPSRDVASWTIMISVFARQGRIIEARNLFDEIPVRDVCCWNTMISAYIENEMIELAEGLFVKMPQHNLDSWNELVNGYVVCRRWADAIRIFEEMPRKEARIWNSVLLGLIRTGLVEAAHALFEKCSLNDVVSWTNLIVGYFKVGNVSAACTLFDSMPNPDETSWNATIAGLAENDHGEEGLRLFSRMRERGLKPDPATFTTVMNICSILPSLDFGKQVHGQSIKTDFDSFVAVGNAILTMYARCGSIHEAYAAFSTMPSHDTISWNAIICGFAQHGHGKEALGLFKQMRLTDIKPDRITFIGVLAACSHAGLIDEGLYYFDFMTFKCFLNPNSEHYTCIVDLLGRFGYIEEAKKFINRMGKIAEPGASVWGALLGACRTHGNVEVGEVAGEKLLEMDPENAGAYVILAEIYLAAGRKRDVERVWVLMRERGVKKQPGCSWIEVKNSVHVFLAGDGSHPDTDGVYNILDLLNLDMEIISIEKKRPPMENI